MTSKAVSLIKNLPKISRSIETSYAPSVWKYLNGSINVYKPSGISTSQVKLIVKTNLTRDLNSMDLAEPLPLVQIENNDGNYAINVVPNLAQDELATGPRYAPNDIKCNSANFLGFNTSGVLVLGINRGTNLIQRISLGAPIQTYHITGKFGKATETNFKGSLLVSRATFDHIHSEKLISLLASMQALHQRKMYDMCGVDLQSQAAYELACKGIIRPLLRNSPFIYGIRCIEFKRPEFTLEINAVNASEPYLCGLICEIGMKLRSVAHCRKIRCTRYGYFTYNDSLLRSHWNLQNIVDNFGVCRQLIERYPEMLSDESSTPVGTITNEVDSDNVK